MTMGEDRIKLLTLVVVESGGEVLLGLKKRGFGAGKWNGFGGKVEPGESIADAARRELSEEACIEATDLEHRAITRFRFGDEREILEVHIFACSSFRGTPKETDEMHPQWFSSARIPYDGMWPDDVHWLPKLLAGERFQAYFGFAGYDDERITHMHFAPYSPSRHFPKRAIIDA